MDEPPEEAPPSGLPAKAPKSRFPAVRDARFVFLAIFVFALTLVAIWRVGSDSTTRNASTPKPAAQAAAGPPRAPEKQRLRGERKLLGLVLDDQQQPLKDVAVRVSSLDDENALPWTAISDGEGRFAFDDLVAHALVVEVSRAGYDASERTLRAEDSGELTFNLARQGQVQVALRDTPGNAVTGAVVTLTGPGLWPALSLSADAQGEVLFENLAFGEYRVRARRDGRAAAASEKVRVVPGERARVTLTLGPALSLNAVVTDRSSGAAITDVEVEAHDATPSIPPRALRSDATGTLRLDGLLPGTLRLELRHAGYAPASVDVTLPLVAPLKVELDGEAKLRGQVVDERGRPVEGAMLSVATRDGLPVSLEQGPSGKANGPGELGVTSGPVPKIPIFGAAEPGLGTLASQSDAQGAFSVAGLAPVPIVLRVARAGYAEASLAIADLVPHQERGDLRVVLHEAGRIEGTIRDARGHGVGGVYISAHAPGSSERSTVSDGGGNFALLDLLGPVTVSAEPQGYTPLSCQVSVSAGATLRCDLTVGSTLYELPVRVVDDFGFGLEGVVLTLSAKAASRTFTQVSRRDGSALLRELPEPPYRLDAALDGFISQSLELSEAERELRIKLIHAASLAGIVTDSLGHPVPDAMVSTDEGDATASTDAHGNFVLTGVTPGALYVLSAHPQAGEGVSAEVRARGGERLASLRVVLSGRYLPSAAQAREPKDEARATAQDTTNDPSQDAGTAARRPLALPARRTKPADFELMQRGSETVFAGVTSGGGMERAGARAGDVLLSIDGEQVLSAAHGRGILRDPPGHFANLRLLRGRAQVRVRYRRPEL